MKTTLRLVAPWAALWIVLGALLWLLAGASNGYPAQLRADIALLALPALAAWLTTKTVAALPWNWPARLAFWIGTSGGWLAFLLIMQARFESTRADTRQNDLLALGFAAFAVIYIGWKARTFPRWRTLLDATTGVAVLALAGGAWLWNFNAGTRSLLARAEARWAEIGLPMSDFEKSLAPTRENSGSDVARQILREQVGALFYKDGTAAAQRETPLGTPRAELERVFESVYQIGWNLPPGDDLDLTGQPTAVIEPLGPALDAAYRRILAAEPPAWACNPADGFEMAVPNFLGLRKFSQLCAADAMRRLAARDHDGAARAFAAGQRLQEHLRENPTLVALLFHSAMETLLAARQVRLPAVEGAIESIARDTALMRAELLRRMQMEAWTLLRFCDHAAADSALSAGANNLIPRWLGRLIRPHQASRYFASSILNSAEHAAIRMNPTTRALPDFGASMHDSVSAKNPSLYDINVTRSDMRIHATLLLREQTELIRHARARLAARLPVESRDSVVLPGTRWELTADAEKNTVATRLANAPEWIAKDFVTGTDFWHLPLDGSIAWQFRPHSRTVESSTR